HRFPDIRKIVRYVRLLIGVIFQIIQFYGIILPIMNQLPGSLPYDGRWITTLIPIMGVMPEQWTFGQFSTLQKDFQADPITMLVGHQSLTSQIENGRKEICSSHRIIHRSWGVRHPGYFDEIGLPDTAFP